MADIQSAAAEIRRRKEKKKKKKGLECRPMPNVMAAQPNIGGDLCEKFRDSIPCSMPQSLADGRCSNAVQ